ncbi:MAG: branched-chain amino acid ABC transporter permease [Rhodospirillales bacterium 70-18]|nr:branched-chain amino acid ABC transporter permease [Rhodospirillales bacterium]OJY76906.1 MAG: branched-chain amino acid ABC transporter permease [Rhodospirillales bacterium 70-18]
MTPRARAAASLRAASRWRPAEYAFWAAALASWLFLPGQYLLLNEIAIAGLFAVSLDLVLGYGGIVSLGHAAFFGFGAYVAGLLTMAGVAEPLTGLLIAGVATTLLGLATSVLVLRGSDLTRIMVTLSVSLVLLEIANRMTWLTGGADGLQGIAFTPLLGLFEFDMFGRVAYGYSLAVLFVLFALARRLVVSPFGWSVRAASGNPLRTAAIGIPVTRRLVGVYGFAAGLAGVAGALLAQTSQFVSLDVLAFHRSAEVLLMLVIGGTGYLYGGLIGALLFKVVQDRLAELTPQYWQFWIGLLLVLLVLAGRERLFALPRAAWRAVWRRA